MRQSHPKPRLRLGRQWAGRAGPFGVGQNALKTQASIVHQDVANVIATQIAFGNALPFSYSSEVSDLG